MIFLFNKHYTETNFLKSKNVKLLNPLLELHSLKLRSYHLDKKIKVDLYLPTETDVYRSTLLINDGQHMEQLGLVKTLTVLLSKVDIPNIGVVAIHDYEKKIEAGIEGIPVHKNRGKKAERYANFITHELTPYLQNNYGLMRKEHHNAFAGFSGGAFSALNISWDNPHLFRKVGVFSGVFSITGPAIADEPAKSLNNAPERIGEGEKRQCIKFWFQTGTGNKKDLNEKKSNDLLNCKTLDFIKELETLGYKNEEIIHKEIAGGQNNLQTWSMVLPEFLKWAFPVKTRVKIKQY